MNNSRQSDIPGYLYALDGMRAISLIFIVIFHTFQQSWIFYNLKTSICLILKYFNVTAM